MRPSQGSALRQPGEKAPLQFFFQGFFDSIIRCDRVLPELSLVPTDVPASALLKVRFDASRVVPMDLPNVAFRPWLADADRVVQGRHGDSILIRVRELADFEVQPGTATVRCCPHPQAHPASVRHFLLNQILPRLVSVRDPLVIHASAVAAGVGAIGLIGPAGCGKSTLSASFASSGEGALISDDGVLMRLAGRSACLVGAYARSRLRPDSFDALGLDEHHFPSDSPVGGKHVLKVSSDRPVAAVPTPIRGLFLLTAPAPDQRDVRVMALTGAAAVIALIENSFLLEPNDRSQLRNQFEAATALIRTGCPFYSLTYPRRFADLPQVRSRILSTLGG